MRMIMFLSETVNNTNLKVVKATALVHVITLPYFAGTKMMKKSVTCLACVQGLSGSSASVTKSAHLVAK